MENICRPAGVVRCIAAVAFVAMTVIGSASAQTPCKPRGPSQPIAQAKPEGTGHVDIAQAKPEGTGHVDIAQAKPEGTGHVDIAQAKPEGTGHVDIAQAKPEGSGHVESASKDLPECPY